MILDHSCFEVYRRLCGRHVHCSDWMYKIKRMNEGRNKRSIIHCISSVEIEKSRSISDFPLCQTPRQFSMTAMGNRKADLSPQFYERDAAQNAASWTLLRVQYVTVSCTIHRDHAMPYAISCNDYPALQTTCIWKPVKSGDFKSEIARSKVLGCFKGKSDPTNKLEHQTHSWQQQIWWNCMTNFKFGWTLLEFKF